MPATSNTALRPSGPEIRAQREARDFTRAELAAAVGVSENSIYRWEREDARPYRTTERRLVAILWPEAVAS